MDAAPITNDQLQAAVAALELRIERRLGALEADMRELNAVMLRRDGPVMTELRSFEERVSDVEAKVTEAQKKNGLLGKAEVVQIARDVMNEAVTGGRSSTDYMMRIVLFATSLGTLIFVTRGGV